MTGVTFFTKDKCPLCQAAWFVVDKLRRRIDFDLKRVDITASGNEKWYALYCNDIPVIHVNGKEAFKHRVSERALRELLESQND